MDRAPAKACSELTLGVDGDAHLDRTPVKRMVTKIAT
jgi:hypothetical protein